MCLICFITVRSCACKWIYHHHEEFTEVTMIGLKKKTKATKCSNYCTVSLIAHTAKIIAKILRGRIEKKIEGVLEEEQFGFIRGKGTRM